METAQLHRRKPRELATAYLAVAKQEVNPHREIIDQAILPHKEAIITELHIFTNPNYTDPSIVVDKKITIGSVLVALYPDKRQQFGINEALWSDVLPVLKKYVKHCRNNWELLLKCSAQAAMIFTEHRQEILTLVPRDVVADWPKSIRRFESTGSIEKTKFLYMALFRMLFPEQRNKIPFDMKRAKILLNTLRQRQFSILPRLSSANIADFFLAFPEWRTLVSEVEVREGAAHTLRMFGPSRVSDSFEHYAKLIEQSGILTADHTSIDANGVHLIFSDPPQQPPAPLPARSVV